MSEKDNVNINIEVQPDTNPPKVYWAQCEAINKEGKRCGCRVQTPTSKYCAFHQKLDSHDKETMAIYYNMLNEDEADHYVRFLDLGDSLEHEIAMTRIFLVRAMKQLAECKGEDVIVEYTEKGWSDQFGESKNTRQVNKTQQLKKEVHTLLTKLKDLMKTSYEIGGDTSEDAQTKAKKVIEAIQNMKNLRENEQV